MKFYYTGASVYNNPQTEPSKSLGGFMSSSIVPNNNLNKVFGEISMFTPDLGGGKNIIGLILKNELQNITNLKFWFDTNPNNLPYAKYTISIVNAGINEKGEVYIEKIPSISSDPYIGEFYEMNGESNALLIGDFQLNRCLGIWLKREIDPVLIKDYYSDDNMEARYLNNTPTSNKEEIVFKLQFD